MTPHFLGPEPSVQFLPDGRNVVVIDHDIQFIDSLGIIWCAPIGTHTDGASIPALLWAIIGGPFEGEHRDGAILHDAAYARAPHEEADPRLAGQSARRAAADRMLWEAMIARNTPILKARAILDGVRLGGGVAWAEHARQNPPSQRQLLLAA